MNVAARWCLRIGNENTNLGFKGRPFLLGRRGASPLVRMAVRETLTCGDPLEVKWRPLHSLKITLQKFCVSLTPAILHTSIPAHTTLRLSTNMPWMFLSGILERYIEVWSSLWLLFFFFFLPPFEICIQCKCLTLLTLVWDRPYLPVCWGSRWSCGFVFCSHYHLIPQVLSAACHPWETLHSNTMGKHPVPIIGPVAGVTCPSFLRVLRVLGCLLGSQKHSWRRKGVLQREAWRFST